jgi:hypothetical protein
MSNLSTAVTVANEIVKAVDFTYSHEQSINNIVLALQAVLAKGSGDYIIGGSVTVYPSGGLNVSIEPLYGHCAGSMIDFVETEKTQPVSFDMAHPSLDRIDIIQVRGVAKEYDYQDRKFRDPASGVESTQNVATKKKVVMDVMVKKGSEGSVTAPLADIGYIKLAEIVIPAGTVTLTADNIKNISARYADAENAGWTMDKKRTINPGYLAEVITRFLKEHGETGEHKAHSIKAVNLLLGGETGAINGKVIPTGAKIQIRDEEFESVANITAALTAVAGAVNMAYTYADTLLSRYRLVSDVPVAASTGHVDIVNGGEQVVDGIPCTVGQMVLLKDQAEKKQNGLWRVQTGPWNRYEGYSNTNPQGFVGKFILIKQGTENGGKVFFINNDLAVIDTDALVFLESVFSSKAMAGKAIIRDAGGRAQVGEPVEAADIARKAEVEAEGGKREVLRIEVTGRGEVIEPEGRDLLTVLGVNSIGAAMEQLRARSNGIGVPDYRKLRLGDYLDGIDLSAIPAENGGTAGQAWNGTYKSNRIVLSGFNTYKHVGDSEVTKNHLLFTFRNIPLKKRMNPTNDTIGGYGASEMRAFLEGVNGDGSGDYAGTTTVTTGAFLNALKAKIGEAYILPIRRLLSLRPASGGSWGWLTCSLFLASEHEIFGESGWGDCGYDDGLKVQFPIYQQAATYRSKRYNGVRDWYWECSPHAGSSASFAHVYTNGGAGINDASVVGGCAPAFCVA